MKIEKLTDNSVKIEFSIPEMEKRSLNVDKLNVDAPAYKKLVADMVSFAEIELGCKIGSASVQYNISETEPKISFVIENVINGKNAVNYNSADNSKPAVQDNGDRQNTSLKGMDLAAEFIGRMMLDSFMAFQAVASKGRSALGDNASDDQDIRDGEEIFDQGTGDEEGAKREPLSISEALEMRRCMLFGDDYKTAGGIGVIAFPSYGDLYAFLKGNSFDNYRSKLIEYREVLYLIVFAGKTGAKRLAMLDSLAGEYRGVAVPSDSAAMILAEYGEPVFEKDAIKKVRESLG